MKNQIYLLAVTFMLAGGQVLFKKIGLAVKGTPPVEAILTALRDPMLYGALALYGVATLLWIWILSRVPLALAYPWVAVGMVIVPLLAWFLFDEPIGPTFWLGAALVVAGIILIQYGAQSA